MNKFNESKLYYHALQTKMGKLFLCTLTGFVILFVGYFVYAGCTLRGSQAEIKKCYAEHIKKADSLYYNLSVYNKDALTEVQKTNDALLADSLIRLALSNTRKLSKEQTERLETILRTHFDNTEQMHYKYGERLTRDSLRLATERELLEGQTKNMIDLHLNKVEHEYSNITLWCAVLTILFLVFSFYSLYKMDELIQQGNDSLKEIKSLKRDGEKSVERFNESSKAQLEESKTLLQTTIDVQMNRMTESIKVLDEKREFIEQQYNISKNNLALAKKAFEQEGVCILEELGQKLVVLESNYNKQLQMKTCEMNAIISTANSMLEQISKNVESLNVEPKNEEEA